MDSLVTSAIALAAGGWQNVKLVGIYTTAKTSIPTWRLGICSVNTLITDYSSANGSIGLAVPVQIIAPRTSILLQTSISPNREIYFDTSEIVCNTLQFTAILFRW